MLQPQLVDRTPTLRVLIIFTEPLMMGLTLILLLRVLVPTIRAETILTVSASRTRDPFPREPTLWVICSLTKVILTPINCFHLLQMTCAEDLISWSTVETVDLAIRLLVALWLRARILATWSRVEPLSRLLLKGQKVMNDIGACCIVFIFNSWWLNCCTLHIGLSGVLVWLIRNILMTTCVTSNLLWVRAFSAPHTLSK